MRYSENWKNWIANIDEKTCKECWDRHGKIYGTDEAVNPHPPLHPNCRCQIKLLLSAEAGTMTPDGTAGADWFVKYLRQLPDNYLTKYDAAQRGWNRRKGNLAKVLSGYQIFGGIYENRNGHLLQEDGRIWYEADLNYTESFRSTERLVFSNDGLVFVTYDHYITFVEVN